MARGAVRGGRTLATALCAWALGLGTWFALGCPGTPAADPVALGSHAPGTPAAATAARAALDAPGRRVLSGVLDWGDPDLVESGDTYYLYSSQPLPWVDLTVEQAPVGGRWGKVSDALPDLPPWAAAGSTWAPEVQKFGGEWVLYFSAQLTGVTPATHCIGDAVATTPSGPFRPVTAPFVCQRDHGGSIDPRVYVDESGMPHLVWKSDNNSDTARYGPPVIWSQRLSGDGRRLLGRPVAIFRPDRPWQRGMVEAPDLVRANGRLWLFFSAGGGFTSVTYAIGTARCTGPNGPCVDSGAGPLLASNAQGEGPGEASVFTQGREHWLVYNPARSVNGTRPRPVEIAPLSFGPDGPVVSPAT